MKKLLVIAMLMSGALAGFSQGVDGQVSFRNSDQLTSAVTGANGHQNRLVYYTDNTTALIGTNWLAQLYYATGSGVAESSLGVVNGTADIPSRFRSQANVDGGGIAGTWVGTGKTIVGVPQNTALTLQVRVWDGSLFGSYETALQNNGVTGKSSTFAFTTPSGSPPSASGLIMENLQSFTLVVPEPSTIALGILGAASLLVVRRRK
jgi:hypothetical protein